MVRIAPFRGVFYNQKKIKDLAKVIAPPYDVIAKEEQEKLYKKSPYNFVRLDLSSEPDSYNTVAQLLQRMVVDRNPGTRPGAGDLLSDSSLRLERRQEKIAPGFFRAHRVTGFFHRRHSAS